MKSEEWTKMGELTEPRHAHGATIALDSFIVVGGQYSTVTGHVYYQLSTERCDFASNGTSISCSTQNPIIDRFAHYPELFNVNQDYCSGFD